MSSSADSMSISVNGESQIPPGFRFHPTEEELLQYYLRKKVASEKIDMDVIKIVDRNKLEPWDIQEKCKVGSALQSDWYFFSHRDKRYPTSTRTNRATAVGFWKATGRDKVIYNNSKGIGMRKTLVFYTGRAPHGQKSDWIMHEYRLDDNTTSNVNVVNNVMEEGTQEGWVVCRMFKKKTICHQNLSRSIRTTSCNDGTLEQMLHYIDTPFTTLNNNDDENNMRFLKLPNLHESLNSSSRIQTCYQPIPIAQVFSDEVANYQQAEIGVQDWITLDRFVASHLNGHNQDQLVSLLHQQQDFYQNECDIWSFGG